MCHFRNTNMFFHIHLLLLFVKQSRNELPTNIENAQNRSAAILELRKNPSGNRWTSLAFGGLA